MKKIILALAIFSAGITNAQFNLDKVKSKVEEKVKSGNLSTKLTEQEIIDGLKEALTTGAGNAGKVASAADGFNKNNLIRIPFPEDAKNMETSLRKVGMGKKVDEFEVVLNRAAEEAAKKAAPIFIDAVKNMSVKDGLNILKGEDNAATKYMEGQTTDPLYAAFKPIVVEALNTVNVTKNWNPLVSRYNKIPLTKKVNPDLEDYTTKKAIAGIFVLLAQEEKKIRDSDAARVTDLLKKVFAEQ